jgi:hypothetical protein
MKPDGQRPEKNMINVVPEESVHSARYGFHMLPVEPEICISSEKVAVHHTRRTGTRVLPYLTL